MTSMWVLPKTGIHIVGCQVTMQLPLTNDGFLFLKTSMWPRKTGHCPPKGPGRWLATCKKRELKSLEVEPKKYYIVSLKVFSNFPVISHDYGRKGRKTTALLDT